MTDLVTRFRDSLALNVGRAHGPLAAPALCEALVARVSELAGGAPVAVPGVDAVLDALKVPTAVSAAGIELVRPVDPSWREAVEHAAVGVTGTVAGIAQTGSVAVACGPGAPRAVSLVPDVHLCVLRVDDLHDDVPDAVAAVVARGMPSNLVWISGPSRSADLEKRMTLGVHGPRAFEVFLLEA